MTSPTDPETPISKALKKRKELQEAICVAMKELEKIDEFIRMWRHLTVPVDNGDKGEDEETGRMILGRAGYGQTQPAFEHMVRAILQAARRPMRSSEIVEAFRNRGEPIGGNETRTAWNRLWQATKRGVLINVPKYGYWLADEPVPRRRLHRRLRSEHPGYQGRQRVSHERVSGTGVSALWERRN